MLFSVRISMKYTIFLLGVILLFPLYGEDYFSVTESWINEKRAESGLVPLEREVFLVRSAQSYASELSGRRILTHRDRENRGPWERYGLAGGTALAAGEILGTSSAEAALGEIFEAWWNSPAHREQILNPRWTCLGIGMEEREGVRIMAVEFSSSLMKNYRFSSGEGGTVLEFEPLSYENSLSFRNVMDKSVLLWEKGGEGLPVFRREDFPLLLEAGDSRGTPLLERGNRFVLSSPPLNGSIRETDRAVSGP